ncbi:helix-turn-helix domain-containing protein [Rahnella sp. Larv3_ips]|uniref:helix-turn-helix domain-containing protein n=1 Tax=Rahnella sp. Larv3_ips TaxID=1896943 RepID=UPI000EFC7D58|nr:helix-turn-helix domain-containing protein [Rahnella sp. Larv3_ips]MBB6116537.1 hypothetical protein [Rahnella inusitata]THD52132.1 hypothetical protein ERD95_07855 [Enterobacteriaceae bacterium ML5]
MYDLNKVVESKGAISEIDDIFSSIETEFPLKKGVARQRFSLDQDEKRMCLILYSGSCILKRTNDSLVLSTIVAPNIVGLQDVFHSKSDVQIVASTDIEYRYISVDDLFLYAENKHLWKSLCYFMMLSTTRFSEYQRETVGISNYEMICNFLKSLCHESFEVRATTTALDYIQGRCMLSRSGILKTLSTLKAGGYITIKNGLLININSLPKRF